MKLTHNPVVKLSVACSLTLAFAAAAGAAEADVANPTQDPMAFARGARTWADNCSRCHNIRDPRELRDDQWRAVMAHMRLRAGLTGQDTRDILKFMQESNSSTAMTTAPPVVSSAASAASVAPSAVAAATPETLYNRTCVACHGANGKGALPGVSDLTSDQGPLARKSDEALVRSILDGMQTPGSAMAMPVKGGSPALSDEDAARLVRFLRERFRAE